MNALQGLSLVAACLALMTLYLLVLTVAALFAHTRASVSGDCSRRFALLIPAHNEARLIGRLLASLRSLDYPSARFDICVVADNCTDATAVIAREAGACVYERLDDSEKSKGHALRWLLAHLRAAGLRYDAYVVLDADSVVSSNFLRVMDAYLARGSQVVQAHYSVLNAQESAVAGLRYAALAAVHYVRPLGRSVFGLSCGLKGNGMCFASDILDRFAWRWFSLAEDVEFHLALIREGIGVAFAPEAEVRAEMPVTLGQATSQNARWEAGRLELLRRHVPGLLREALRGQRLLRLDAAVEQLIPPLSVPFALAGACFCAGVAVGSPILAALAAFTVVGQLGHLLAGMLLLRAPLSSYLAFAVAPAYVGWKLALYLRLVCGRGRTGAWVRTSRVAPTKPAHS